jgi:hypothetical protein
VQTTGCEPNSDPSDRMASRSVMTIQFCASGWQTRAKELVTANKRRRNRPWKTLQRSFWLMWTRPKAWRPGLDLNQDEERCTALALTLPPPGRLHRGAPELDGRLTFVGLECRVSPV